MQSEVEKVGFEKHGLCYTEIHKKWKQMRYRCLNSNGTGYHLYGGRGIKICSRWTRFMNFYDDMNTSFEIHIKRHGIRNTTLDRINSDGDYKPKNCRWATRQIQGRNTRYNTWIELDGNKMRLRDWAQLIGIHRTTLEDRIKRWGIRKALTVPKLTSRHDKNNLTELTNEE